MVDLKELDKKLEGTIKGLNVTLHRWDLPDFIENGIDKLKHILGSCAIVMKDIKELSGKEKLKYLIKFAMKYYNLRWMPDWIERKIYYLVICFVVERLKRKGWDINKI